MTRARLAALVLLAALTLGVYWPVTGYDFVNLDDEAYVTANRHVQGGLTLQSVRWAFLSPGYAANWHPLTWISHQLDVTLFGLAPGRHHLTSLLLHTGATLLLFTALRLATGAVWASAATAALFAVHPLRAESVAWIAERKDVLSALFWMLTTVAYVAYARRPGVARRAVVAVCFALGLLAKPMLVTLPLVLLLLDAWPLGRLGPPGRAGRARALPLLLEKLPLLLLAGAAAAVTYFSQQRGGGLVMGAQYGPGARLANATLAPVRYLGMLLFPHDLAVLYPFRDGLPALEVAGAALLLLAATAVCLAAGRRHPWLRTGWLWYLVVLLPVVGVVQIGFHSVADRYTYLPCVGLALLLVWEAADRARALPGGRAALGAATALALLALTLATRHQLAFWRDSESLLRRAADVVPDNWMAENNLGAALHAQGRYAEAVERFSRALRVRPDFARARVNLAGSLGALGRRAEALEQLEAALRSDPSFPTAWMGRGNLRLEALQFEAAAADFRRAVELKPDSAEARCNLGVALFNLGRYEEALAQFRESVRLDPSSSLPRLDIGIIFYRTGRLEEAGSWLEEAARRDLRNAEARYMLGLLAERRGRPAEAIEEYRAALRIAPGHPLARARLARLPGGGGP